MIKRDKKVIILEDFPFNGETSMETLSKAQTPTSEVYVRNHFDVPQVDENNWNLRLEDDTENTIDLCLKELKKFPSRNVYMTMECAGNGRIFMSPVPSGTPWEFGGVSFVNFKGTSLSNVLNVNNSKKHGSNVVFFGADKGEVKPGREEYYGRSLPIEKALHPDTILAWEINNEPLPPDHGFPLRLVVPGWYGVASVKWLDKIKVQSKPHDGYYQKDSYWYKLSPEETSGEPVSNIRIRSLIAYPLNEQKLPLQEIEVKGSAWSNGEKISKVEVSFNGGKIWTQTDFIKNDPIYGPTIWKINWLPREQGDHHLMVKTTAENGNTQPINPYWNEGGYGNNFIHKIKVIIE